MKKVDITTVNHPGEEIEIELRLGIHILLLLESEKFRLGDAGGKIGQKGLLFVRETWHLKRRKRKDYKCRTPMKKIIDI